MMVHIHCESNAIESIADRDDRIAFVDILRQMLAMDQNKRISPGAALNHRFVTMAHLEVPQKYSE